MKKTVAETAVEKSGVVASSWSAECKKFEEGDLSLDLRVLIMFKKESL